MSEPIKACPLQWPVGWKRTEPHRRARAKFGKAESYQIGDATYSRKGDLSIADGTARVLAELRRMGVDQRTIIISTNLRLRNDGLPLSKQRQPDDPGAAVYWTDPFASSKKLVIAADLYDKIEENLAAIAATIEAMRAIERHGGAVILERAFTGFTALPPPVSGQKPWRTVFGFAPEEQVTELRLQGAYRTARSEAHPDREGGSHEAFLSVQAAYEAACRELGFTP